MEGAPSIPARNNRCDCPKSGAWLTYTAAKRRLKKIQRKSNRRRTPIRIYECDAGVFHLTSQEQRGEA